MRILLDECSPRELADELVGHEVWTVQQEGWAGLENGELLQRAAATFAVFLTIDQRIHQTQRLPETLAVLTIPRPPTRNRVGPVRYRTAHPSAVIGHSPRSFILNFTFFRFQQIGSFLSRAHELIVLGYNLQIGVR